MTQEEREQEEWNNKCTQSGTGQHKWDYVSNSQSGGRETHKCTICGKEIRVRA